MSRNLILIFSILLLARVSDAQDHCGTACPVCTGELKLDRNSESYNSQLLKSGSFNWFTIYTPVPHDEDGEKGSTSLSFGLFNRLETGLTMGLESWEVRGKIKTLAIPESKFRPALIAGVGNFSPTDVESNGYLMLAKGIKWTFPIWSYAGMAKPFDGRKVEPILGLSVGVVPSSGLMAIYDGQEFHLGAAYQPIKFLSFGAMAVEMQQLGLFASFNGNLAALKSTNTSEP